MLLPHLFLFSTNGKTDQHLRLVLISDIATLPPVMTSKLLQQRIKLYTPCPKAWALYCMPLNLLLTGCPNSPQIAANSRSLNKSPLYIKGKFKIMVLFALLSFVR